MNLSGKAGEAVKVRRGLKYVAAVVLAVGIYFYAMVVMGGYHMYRDAVVEISLEDKVASIRDKGNYTTYHELPKICVDAVLSVEDHRFYNYPGINVIAIGRAVSNDIRAGASVEGGGTVTQQSAKNMYFTQEKELQRKMAEMFVAFDPERNYSRSEILELYVSTIYYGNGYYCVKDVNRGYSGEEPGDMTDYESTLLAGIPSAPSKYTPTVSQELTGKRQEQVLVRLVKCGYFTEERALEALVTGNMPQAGVRYG